MVEHLLSGQQLSEAQLLKPPVRQHQKRREPTLDEWLALPIRRPKGQRPIICGNAEETAAVHRKVRFDWVLGIIYEYSQGNSRKGDSLNFKAGNRYYALQQHLIATASWRRFQQRLVHHDRVIFHQ